MTKKFFLFFKKILINKFLAIFLIILLYLLSKIKINPLLSDWLIDIIVIYLIIYFFIPLFHFFKKDSFLLNGLIFIVGFLFLLEFLSTIKNRSEFLFNFTGIIFFSFVFSYIVSLIFNIFLFFSKKITLLKFVLSIVFLLVALFLFYPPKIIGQKLVDFYYQKINKKAGLIYYEKQYFKLIKEDATLLKNLENTMNYFDKEANFSFDYLKNNKEKINHYLKKRDEIKEQLLAIEKKQLQIKLSKQYDKFFKLRQKALAEKNEATYMFKRTIEVYINAFEVYHKFWQFLNEKKFLTNIVVAKEEKNKEDFLKIVDYYQKDLDDFYEKNIKNIKLPLFDEVKKEMSAYYFSINELLKIMKEDAIKTNTKEIEDKEALKKFEVFSQEFLRRQQNGEFGNWRDTAIRDFLYFYSEKGIESYNLYKKAYLYAKKNNLSEIIKVWGDDYPLKELKIN